MTDEYDGGMAMAEPEEPVVALVAEVVSEPRQAATLTDDARDYLLNRTRRYLRGQRHADAPDVDRTTDEPEEERTEEEVRGEVAANVERLVARALARSRSKEPLNETDIADTLANAGICPLWPFC